MQWASKKKENKKYSDSKLAKMKVKSQKQVIRGNIFKTYKVVSWKPVSYMSFATFTPRLRYRRSVTKW